MGGVLFAVVCLHGNTSGISSNLNIQCCLQTSLWPLKIKFQNDTMSWQQIEQQTLSLL